MQKTIDAAIMRGVVGVVALLPFTNLSPMVRMLEAWEADANHN